jgi:hypothetical protein
MLPTVLPLFTLLGLPKPFPIVLDAEVPFRAASDGGSCLPLGLLLPLVLLLLLLLA